MAGTTTDIISEVRGMSRKGDTVEVEVETLGPVGLEGLVRQRAKARALLSSGVIKAAGSTVGDLSAGDIERMTVVKSSREETDPVIDDIPVLGKLLQSRRYTIAVNSSDNVRERLMD